MSTELPVASLFTLHGNTQGLGDMSKLRTIQVVDKKPEVLSDSERRRAQQLLTNARHVASGRRYTANVESGGRVRRASQGSQQDLEEIRGLHPATAKNRFVQSEALGRLYKPTTNNHIVKIPAPRDSKPCQHQLARNDVSHGDRAFVAERYEDAAHYYSDAIDLEPANTSLYAKRCASLACLGKFKLALIDAKKILKLEPMNHKGSMRKRAVEDYMKMYEEGRPGWETAHLTLLRILTGTSWRECI